MYRASYAGGGRCRRRPLAESFFSQPAAACGMRQRRLSDECGSWHHSKILINRSAIGRRAISRLSEVVSYRPSRGFEFLLKVPKTIYLTAELAQDFLTSLLVAIPPPAREQTGPGHEGAAFRVPEPIEGTLGLGVGGAGRERRWQTAGGSLECPYVRPIVTKSPNLVTTTPSKQLDG